MIASRSLGFIFLKTRKTGGTSVEIVLSAWCDETDVCAPIHKHDEVIRAAYGGAARNFLDAAGEQRFFNHMPARKVRSALPELWRTAHRFAIERHPYEKVVSRAWWNVAKKQGDPRRDVEREIEDAIVSDRFLNYPIYTIGDRLAVQQVIPYERMWERLAELGERFGRKLPAELPSAKAGHRLDRRLAADVLTRGQKDRIYDRARFEFELMGYAR